MVRRWLRLAMVMTGLMAGHAKAMPSLPTEALCAAETAKAERSYDIPSQLLDAISLVESGRYSKDVKAVLAWPWTVTSGGEGKYFPTKAEAVAEVRRLKAKGVKNIDVGCMQVNLMYHGNAFANLDEAFEPGNNVAYAARFLRGLYSSVGHWETAASYYHSQTPHLAAAYRAKLVKIWNNGGSRNAIANLAPLSEYGAKPTTPPRPATPAIQPRPADPKVAQIRKDWQDQQSDSRSEAKRIADAYRQARLVEYDMRKSQFRPRYGLSSN